MGRPAFTEYLLKLATDVKELDRYRQIRDGHDKSTSFSSYLAAQGLEAGQIEALEHNDSHKIIKAVVEELNEQSSNRDNPFWGIGITFTVECNRITHPHPPPL